MPRFRGGGEVDESKPMDDKSDSQPAFSESVDDEVSTMSHETSLHSLENLRSALAINIKSAKKVVVEEIPAPCSSPSSSFSADAWTQVQQISHNSILNKRKLADKLSILALAREKSTYGDDSSEEEDAEGAASLDSFCLLQTNKRGKSTMSDTTRTSIRAKFKNPLAVKKPR
ncbi:hypothetical protein MPTK1_4g21520 [Marchantia polymorpha subsp. ruderalis]|uniref:Uncharacterized protein n=2 Tax=Marchantia polymorpha TaxID=3197 RepID=A0A176W3A5_MARPO|nr:hypothetical protein AXG93_3857s1260 [Marchantia polymorpha subsp. ruderalis]PTQ33335.1 hypothetical protein MARPO_0090s0069 [Marchantia polymorpha]BBN09651.1 hypothetical protein Mp_4g21520 [Marchantia polymorpha subsp. ruderalis]|eukprot:PTQ33335.1 hypothetical protein MARPO_0090s0069 [Marchantia polymorpha]